MENLLGLLLLALLDLPRVPCLRQKSERERSVTRDTGGVTGRHRQGAYSTSLPCGFIHIILSAGIFIGFPVSATFLFIGSWLQFQLCTAVLESGQRTGMHVPCSRRTHERSGHGPGWLMGYLKTIGPDALSSPSLSVRGGRAMMHRPQVRSGLQRRLHAPAAPWSRCCHA